MPVSSWRLDLTIIAHDIDHSLQIRRHGLFGNVPRSGLPGSRHGLLRNNSLLADGAAIIEASKLAEAMSVDGMTAWQILRRLTRGKHVFATDRTVVLVFVLKTVVTDEDIDADTHATLTAMSEGFCSTDPTETTFVAVERFFVFGHPKVTDIAVVFTKDCIAVDADIAVEETLVRD
jgi:hypothetical protein